MPRSRGRSRTPRAGTLALSSLLALPIGAADLWAEKRASGTKHWQGKEIHYELSGQTSSDVQFRKGERDCRITTIVDGRERTLTLKGEDIDVDGEHLDVGSYARISLNVERAFLIVRLVTTRSWGGSASGSAGSQVTSGTSTATSGKTSRSESSGQATDYHALGFTELNNVPIRFRLKGGRSVDCSIAARPDERVITFDIDEGKNQSSIVVKPGLVIVDGSARTASPVAELLVTATDGSLRITADRTEIWSRD